MANDFLIKEMDDTPKQICLANFSGDFSPTAGNDMRKGVDTEVELVMLDWANAAAIQSAKFDFGALRAESYALRIGPEMQVAAADAGGTIEAFLSPSSSSTPAKGNAGGASGVAGAFTGYSADLDEALQQLIPLGSIPLTDDGVDSFQIGEAGIFTPTQRFGSLILLNKSGQVICDTDDIEAHVVMDPQVGQLQ